MESVIIFIALLLIIFFVKHGTNAVKMTKRENEAEKKILLSILERTGEKYTVKADNDKIFYHLNERPRQYYNIFVKMMSVEDDYCGIAKERYKKYVIPYCLKDINKILNDAGLFSKVINTKIENGEKWIIETNGTFYVILGIFTDEYTPFFSYGIIDK